MAEIHEDGLPILTYLSANADLYGTELQFTWKTTDHLTFTLQGDYIRAKVELNERENLPRIPPIKVLFSADYKTNDYTLSRQVTNIFKQNDVAQYEQSTRTIPWWI